MHKKTKEKELARKLRHEGHSVKDIVKIVGVTQASISVWCRDIKLTEDQKNKLKENKKDVGNNSRFHSKKRKNYREEGQQLAIKYINDPLFAAGCFLYWGEGHKRLSNVIVSNGDPELISFFVRWLRRFFDIDPSQLRAAMSYHKSSSLSFEDTKTFWKNKLGLEDSCFTSPTILEGDETKKNKAPYGFIRVGIFSTEINQKILGALQYYSGFVREEWSY